MGKIWFTKTHLWLREEKKQEVCVGLTDFAQERLAEVTFVELPEVGDHLLADDDVAVIETMSSALEIFLPITGTITAVNTALLDEPELINQDPQDGGWLFKLRPDVWEDLQQLLDEDTYEALLAGEEE